MLSKGFRALAAALLMASALAVGLAQPASAKPTGPTTLAVDPSCPSGYFCVWFLEGYGTPKWQDIDNDSDWSNGMGPITDGTIADDDRSWANNGVPCAGCDHVRVYDGPNQSGGLTLCVHRGQWLDMNSGTPPWIAADRGQSHRWGGECLAGEPHIPF